MQPSHYYVFFKAKDKDPLQPTSKVFTAMTLGREKCPSVLLRLALAQEQSKVQRRQWENAKVKYLEMAR